MLRRKLFFAALFIFLISLLVKADVPPPQDEMRVSTNLQIVTKEDISDFRFFLEFPGILREVEIKSNGATIIEAGGGGARYRRGTLYAVPKKNLIDLGDKPTSNQLSTLLDSLSKNTFEGGVELLKHQFVHDIRKSERDKFEFPTYSIERADSTLKIKENLKIAPKISEEESKQMSKGGSDFVLGGTKREFTPLFYILAGGIVVFTLGIIIFGVRRIKRIR